MILLTNNLEDIANYLQSEPIILQRNNNVIKFAISIILYCNR